MSKKGIVESCTYEDYSYPIQDGRKTLYRHHLIMKLPDGTIDEGKYDSPSLPQKSFIVGSTVEYDSETKTTKNGKPFQKFKKAQKTFSQDNVSPEVRMQIERACSIGCVGLLLDHGLSTDKPLSEQITQINTWIRNKALSQEDTRQSSINAQTSIKLACTYAKSLGIKNQEDLESMSNAFYNYICNG